MLLFRFLVRLVVHKKAVDSMCRTVVTVQRIVVAWSEQKKKDFLYTCLVMDLQDVLLCWKLLISILPLNAGAVAPTYTIVVLDKV